MIVGIAGAAGHGKSTVAKWFVEVQGFVETAFADAMKQFVEILYPDCRNHPEYLFGPAELRKSLVSTKPVEGWTGLAYDFVRRVVGIPETDEQSASFLTLAEMVRDFRERDIVSVREILQKIGSEWGRVVDPDLWTKNLFREIGAMFPLLPEGWKVEKWGRGPLLRDDNVVISDVRFKNEVEKIRDYAQEGSLLLKIRREKPVGFIGGVEGHVSEQGLPDDLFDYVIDAPEGIFKLRRLLTAILMKWKWQRTTAYRRHDA